MKYSTAALSLCLAPLALAKSVHNVYPVRRDANKLAARKAKAQQGSLAGLGLSGFGITETSVQEVIIIWVNGGNNAATTSVNNQVTVTETVTAGAQATTIVGEAGTTTVAAGSSTTVAGTGATHSVIVGGSAGLQFTPSELKAAVGDMVVFTFLSQNHTATQSAFATPCDALEGGMDSGFQANANNTVNPPPQVAMQVMVDTPLWFYCAQKGHCGKGMTFSINPTAEKTQAMFQAMAIAQKGAGAGTAITGNGGAAAGNGSEAAAPAATESTTSLLPLGGSSTTTAAAVASATNGITTGTGTTLADGSCVCAVQCGSIGVGAFPAVAAQGVGAFGGMPGALPLSMAAA